jgi:nicotinate-nucleotide adenylyltransferase
LHCPVKEIPSANINTLKAPIIEISSSLIRKMLGEGKSIRYMVPDTVMEEIERSGYYK